MRLSSLPRQLLRASLVTREALDDGSPAISVHRLVQGVMRRRLGEQAGEIASLATRLVADAYPNPSDDARHWPVCRKLEPHAAAVLAFAPEKGEAAEKTTFLLNQRALYFMALADYAQAEPLYRRALAIDEESFGPTHPNVARDLNNLTQLLRTTNRLSEAEPLMRRALAIDEEGFGPTHPNVARDLNNLGALFQAVNRFSEAEPLLRRALAIDEEGFGPTHPNVARDLNNLGALLQAANRLSEAEALLRRALAIDEESFGPEHPTVATGLNNLAQLLKATNRLAEAEPLMCRALAINEKSFGAEHPTVATSLSNLAQLLLATNRLTEAEPLLHRAIVINEKNFGSEHPTVATSLSNLAQLLLATNRLMEAEPLLHRAIVINEKNFGSEHPTVATSLNNLAQLLQATNRLTEAEPLLHRAISIWKASMPSQQPWAQTGRENIKVLNAELASDERIKLNEAISVLLLELPRIRETTWLSATETCPAISQTRFKSEIEKQLLSAPKVMARLEQMLSSCLPDWGLEDLLLPQEYWLGNEKIRSKILVRAFVNDIPFVYALELLTEAINNCSTESEQKERRALLAILFWFLPASFGLQKAGEVKRQYEREDVHLIQTNIASPMAAELVMAAVQERPAAFDCDPQGDLVGKSAIQSRLPLGLEVTPIEGLLTAASRHLYDKYGRGLPPQAMENFLSSLNNIMCRSRHRDAPYLLFGRETLPPEVNDKELNELAVAIRMKLPWLTILKLSDADDVKIEEFEQLFALRKWLSHVSD